MTIRPEFANRLPIVMYGKPRCVQCDATERWLKSNGVPYVKHDVESDPALLELVKNMGYQQAPVVVVPMDWPTPGHHWSGFNPVNLGKLLA